jgi:hypothetical protein
MAVPMSMDPADDAGGVGAGYGGAGIAASWMRE